MKRNFLELQKFLERRYPSLIGSIEGANYPPPPHAQVLMMVVGYIQMAVLILLFAGGLVFKTLGMEEPEWYKSMAENKLGTFATVFLANAVVGSMTATGAFEVTLDGELVFSKLQSGRMPTADDIMARLTELGVMN